MRIAITGATGFLGRNLLFEIVKRNLNALDRLHVLALGRAESAPGLRDRLRAAFAEDGLGYVGPSLRPSDLDRLLDECVVPIPCDLAQPGLAICPTDLALLEAQPIDHFIHAGALTDLRTQRLAGSMLEEVNVAGTRRILDLANSCTVGNLVYISSAYACGVAAGQIAPDFVNPDWRFRNAYEESKLRAELLVREHARENGRRCTVLRPSTVCGRLIESPVGSTSSFDGFYGWASFFWRERLKRSACHAASIDRPVDLDLRIQINPGSGLDIVPVDYLAKVTCEALEAEEASRSYHVASGSEISHADYVPWILDSLNVRGWTLVEEEPMLKSVAERAYYRSVGQTYTRYAVGPPTSFATDGIERIERRAGLARPVIDRTSFQALMDFAVGRGFGLRHPPIHGSSAARPAIPGQEVTGGRVGR